MNKTALLIFITLFLTACSKQYGRYQQANDSTPTRLPSAGELHDAVPRAEPHSRGGNKNYTVRGKHYQVLKNAENFSQTGIASWYGKKFHGHLTSNGEIYDMYAMSAAHKNLPLPTYAKVTNLSNNKSVIVRVNDRGPFHESRVIDLSYSAAYKLDMLKTGTAKVRITAITDFSGKKTQAVSAAAQSASSPEPATASTLSPTETQQTQEQNQAKAQYYIQILATRDQQQAQATATALANLYQQNVSLGEKNGIFRVQMGPLEQGESLNSLLTTLQQNGYSGAYRRKLLQ
ncbi:septal ring lytic transglycosylase RlpA family protein [Thalassomonas actiniarum]|uniref:Endolytic peptidoglycan transglycosylase RlpA n=1 Tax=Thalassomonas actiniarum TaxID=485447 RepID=A0AAF0C579_9GAMM|nr:septal ring lytic transglycosylase RlpA family protein [Thalassomonas actiniarum]WDE00585.1 septal ring lytic transglycosylase RlpA family protein [Thalassomonas actiniarum]